MKEKKVHVRVIKNGLYLEYWFRGKRTVKTLKLKNTPENYEIAEQNAKQTERNLSDLDKAMIDAGFKKESFDNPIVQDAIERNKVKKTIKKLMGYPLSKALEDYLKENPKKKKNEEQYKYSVKIFTSVCDDKELKEISNDDYNKVKSYLLDNKAYATAATYINYLHILFIWLIKKEKYRNENPFIKLKSRKTQNIQTISKEHMDIFLPELKKSNLELYNFINFLRLTGFRKEEALQLKWSQIDLKKKLIKVITYKDNEREDLFPLNLNGGELLSFLTELEKSKIDDKVFHLKSEWILQPFQKLIEKINKKLKEDKKEEMPRYNLHDFRRTFGSYWAPKVSQIQLMKLMRHKDISTTLNFYISLDILAIGDNQ